MKTIAFLAEENQPLAGKSIPRCWNEIPGARFDSMSEAVEFSLDFRRDNQHSKAVRVVERVQASNGQVIDHQVYPEYRANVRLLNVLRTVVPAEMEAAISADMAQDPVQLHEPAIA